MPHMVNLLTYLWYGDSRTEKQWNKQIYYATLLRRCAYIKVFWIYPITKMVYN